MSKYIEYHRTAIAAAEAEKKKAKDAQDAELKKTMDKFEPSILLQLDDERNWTKWGCMVVSDLMPSLSMNEFHLIVTRVCGAFKDIKHSFRVMYPCACGATAAQEIHALRDERFVHVKEEDRPCCLVVVPQVR